MVRLVEQTQIAAPVERCFQLSLSIDLHMAGAAGTSERAIAGTTTGRIALGETVTWQGRHFGLQLRHTSRITALREPEYFQDAMISGYFHAFAHDHFFESHDGGTLMRDEMCFSAPFGIVGRIVEELFLRRHLSFFLRQRNAYIKKIAESDEWRKYIPE